MVYLKSYKNNFFERVISTKLFNESKNDDDDDYFKGLSSSDYMDLHRTRKHEKWTKEELKFMKKSVLDLIPDKINYEVYEISYGGEWRRQNNRRYSYKNDLLNNISDSKRLENFLKHDITASAVQIGILIPQKNRQKRKIDLLIYITKKEDDWFLVRVFGKDIGTFTYEWYECDQIGGFIELFKNLIQSPRFNDRPDIKSFNESKNDDDYFKEISYFSYTNDRLANPENWTKEELQLLINKIESIILKRNKIELGNSFPTRIQECSLLFRKDSEGTIDPLRAADAGKFEWGTTIVKYYRLVDGDALNSDVSLRNLLYASERDIDKLFKPEVRHLLFEIKLAATWHQKYSSKSLRIHKLQDEWFILKTPVNQYRCDQLSGLVYLLEKIIIEHEID
jgi:hypothetical protein